MLVFRIGIACSNPPNLLVPELNLVGELKMEKLHVTVQQEVDSVTSVVGQV